MSTTHFTTSCLATIELYYVRSFEDSFGLPDGEYVLKHQAYDPLTGKPIGPRGGDPDPAYIRSYMREQNPRAIECRVVEMWAEVRR